MCLFPECFSLVLLTKFLKPGGMAEFRWCFHRKFLMSILKSRDLITWSSFGDRYIEGIQDIPLFLADFRQIALTITHLDLPDQFQFIQDLFD